MTIPVLGFTFPPIDELFRWKPFFLSGPLGFNKTTLLIFLSVTILSVLFVRATRNMELVPRRLQNVAEMGWEFVDRGIVRDVIGPDAANWSPFMARHMEHPASRKSAPASRKILSSPSASACFFTC